MYLDYDYLGGGLEHVFLHSAGIFSGIPPTGHQPAINPMKFTRYPI